MINSGLLIQNLEQYDGLIFDMDGTVVDSMPLHFNAWSAVANEYQLPFNRERFYQLGGVPTLETLQILSKEANREIDLAAAKKMKETLYRAQLHQVRPIDAIVDVIHHFFSTKPMAIATGSSRIGAQKVLTQLDLLKFFDAVVTADDVVNHKPAPDVFVEAARQLGLKPEACAAFEDTDIGLEAIRRANMFAVDVRTIL